MRGLNNLIPSTIQGQHSGWCCIKHELEYSPKELELFDISVDFKPHHNPAEKFLRYIYKIVRQEARESGTHEVVHFMANQAGFILSLKPIDVQPKEKGNLNVDI